MKQALEGNKTYIVGAIGLLATVAYYMQWISTEQFLTIAGIFGFASQITQRLALKKVAPVLLALCLCGSVDAQTPQLMDEQKRQVLLSYLPKLDISQADIDDIKNSLLYSADEIPMMHQSQPLIGGTGAPYTVFMSIYRQVNGSFLPTNMNRDFPWGTPGGLHLVPPDTRFEFRSVSLPPKPGGGVWPVVIYKDKLERSTRINMPSPNGWKWISPAGARYREFLMKNFSDGTVAMYEIRERNRDIDAWFFDRFQPDIEFPPFVSVRYETLKSTHPRIVSFNRSATTHVLPPIADAREQLWKATFRSIMGDVNAIVPTAEDRDNIVPQFYAGHFLTDCNDCHRDGLREASQFEEREWYDYRASSADGIPTFNPFDRSAPGQVNPPLNPILEAAGWVEFYDPEKHPKEIYAVIPEYDHGPRPNSRVTNARVVGGLTQ